MFSYEMLVNMERRLAPDFCPPSLYAPDIPFVADLSDEKRYMETRAAHHAEKLFHAAYAEGLSLYGISGYRSFERQKTLYRNARHKTPALSDSAFASLKDTRTSVPANAAYETAPPGCSEHQTGLALDVSCPAAALQLTPSFGNTPEGKWLLRHAPLYGFLIRYPADKTHVTNLPYEPWHIRYVTRSLALCLTITGQTLEEYYDIAVPSGDADISNRDVTAPSGVP